MKKIITIMGMLLILMSFVSAAPPVPQPVMFGFEVDGKPVENFQVTLILGSDTIKKTTNELGLIMVDVGSGSPDFPNSDKIDLRTANLILDCGFDVCDKTYSVWDLDTPYKEIFALKETPASCPACNCGGGSSGGSGGGVFCSEAKLNEYLELNCVQEECKNCEYPTKEECKGVIETICEDKQIGICVPTGSGEPEGCNRYTNSKDCTALMGGGADCKWIIDETCQECPVTGDTSNAGAWIIGVISTIIAALGGIYFTKNKALGANGGLKIYRKVDGTEVLLHKHPGIKAYHDPKVVHRDVIERHEKGQLYPQYERNEKGIWEYKG